MSKNNIYTPKRTRWGSLTDFRTWLTKETRESVISFNGHELITATTKYTLQFGELVCEPAPRTKPVRETAVKRGAIKMIKSARHAASA